MMSLFLCHTCIHEPKQAVKSVSKTINNAEPITPFMNP